MKVELYERKFLCSSGRAGRRVMVLSRPFHPDPKRAYLLRQVPIDAAKGTTAHHCWRSYAGTTHPLLTVVELTVGIGTGVDVVACRPYTYVPHSLREQLTMPLQLVNANVVLVAHHFNPTITDQLWLTEHAIVMRDEASGPYVFTDMLVQVQTRNFHLLIVPDRCQMTPSPENENTQQLILARLGQLIKLLPHTPYRAVGLNFNWHFSGDNNNIEPLARARFFVPGSPLHELFNVDGSRFGGYMSKGFHEDLI